MGGLANASGLTPEAFYFPPPACGLSILLVYIRAVVECKLIEYLSAARLLQVNGQWRSFRVVGMHIIDGSPKK
jgi:hypothetical protein